MNTFKPGQLVLFRINAIQNSIYNKDKTPEYLLAKIISLASSKSANLECPNGKIIKRPISRLEHIKENTNAITC